MSRSSPRTPATPKTQRTGAHPLAEMDAVEVKVTIRPDQELRAARAMEVDEDTAEVRVIYFYDTPRLDLFKAGVALRARLVKGDDDDSTVKFRPVKADAIAEEWRRTEGFKLEADCVGNRVVCSASHTVVQQRDEIEEVAKGERAIAKLFSSDQERFLGEFYQGKFDFEELRVMGPIRVLRWKLKHKGFPYQLTIEEWRLPNGDDLVEASIKVPPDEAPRAHEEFDQHLKQLGLDPKGAQETKTRTALEYFAKAYREAKS
ncbi:hypothetical protein [Lysobacter niastensis]|uniref:CYTH domain-containing protein n=1 Tax=Lysobacter niastensis TaxID=380629 RepID=A0ABS0B8U3_9GAMM|nr:hypothetical protein [Lysobacter niastensis]MBF6025434.1 hypothetical protein [Lysobacter niastensis]